MSNNKNKIVIIDKSRWYGGAEESLRILVNGLYLRNDFDAYICFDYPMQHQERIICNENKVLYRFKKRKWWMRDSYQKPTRIIRAIERVVYAFALMKIMILVRPQVIHFNLFRSLNNLDICIAKMLRSKIVLHVRSLAVHMKFPRNVMNLGNLIICVSEAVKMDIEKVKSNCQVIRVYNAVDKKTVCCTIDRLTAREKLNLPFDKHIVLSVGNLENSKGHDFAIRSIKHLIDYGYDLILVIVGADTDDCAGKERRRLNQLSSSLMLDDVVFIREYSANISYYYKAADIVCSLHMIGESFGRVPIEAAINKVPVVVTNKGALPEITINDYSGIVVDAGDEKKLASAFTEMIHNKDKRDYLVNNALLRVEEQFGIDQYIQGILKAYYKLLKLTD